MTGKLSSESLRSLRNKYYHISVSWNLDTVFLPSKVQLKLSPRATWRVAAQYKYSKDFKVESSAEKNFGKKCEEKMVKYNLPTGMEEEGLETSSRRVII